MHLLLVEDDRKISEYVAQGLRESRYAVDLAYDGEEALSWLDTMDFDLIILDLMLPKVDGFEVCKRVRNQNNTTPILMLTARDGIEDRVRGLDSGADDYLVKPFSIQELEARVRALLRRTARQGGRTVLEVGDLSLDYKAHSVSRSGVSISLTAKELSILECLMREKEHTLSREQIADHVWGFDAPMESNIVDVYIRNLRRKIDDPYERKLIQTVKGLGYKITETGG